MRDLIASLSGAAYPAAVRSIVQLADFEPGRPTSVWINNKKRRDADGWRTALEEAHTDSWVFWEDDGESRRSISLRPQSDLALLRLPGKIADVGDALAVLEPLPFEICAFGSVFWDPWIKAHYRRWGFSRSHPCHGWGCAFRGPGHDRLVSRRWLEFGPWRVIRRPRDTTLIQFHDLAISDPAEAYEQAKYAHQRMGIDPIGGFIQGIDLDVIAEVRGVYRTDERTLDIVVAPGAQVEQQDMRVACGLRLHHRLTKVVRDRIDHIAYVFIDKADAMAHLHELWLRELQCWYLDERGKHRLDTDYHPTPDPPAWVRALDAKGA